MIIARDARELPDQILLEVTNFNGTRKGEIVWRDERAAGVRFI